MNRLLIVAEAAQGYEGDPTQARLLVRAAAAGGADFVKFQLVYADELAVPAYRWYDLFRTLEMEPDAWSRVRDEALKLGVGLAFDVFGQRSLEQALELGAGIIKIHSTDFFNDSLVAQALERAAEVHLSLGGITTDELQSFLKRHAAPATDKLVLMCGYQAEPTKIEDNHLARLAAMRALLPDQRLGWMDHADGALDEAEWLGVLALPYGVSVVEKHITLARPLDLEDGVSALDPEAFLRYAGRIRRAALALGSSALELTPEEHAYRGRALKCVIATTALQTNDLIRPDMLALKRAPADESREPLRRLDQALQRRATRDIAAGSPLHEEDVR